MPLIIRKVDGNIVAYRIQLLACRHIFLEHMIIPSKAEYSLYAVLPRPLHRIGYDLVQELIHVILCSDDRSDCVQGMSHKIMSMAVTAGRHHKSLAGMVNNFSPALLNKCFGSLPVTHVDVSAVLYGECLCDLTVFRSKDLAIDHKIRAVFSC